VRALLLSLCLLAACSAPPAHEFPEQDHQMFAQGCPTGKPECDCMWDEISRTMTPDEFEASMTRFEEKGLMDPRLTKARFHCREKS